VSPLKYGVLPTKSNPKELLTNWGSVKGVLTFGIDAINIDETPSDDHAGVGFPCHHLIAEKAGVISENLCNLESINIPDPLISLLPLKLERADGAPVRAVAIQTEP
jgi:kynurenine formamidase